MNQTTTPDRATETVNQILWFYQALASAQYIRNERLREDTIREIIEAQKFLRVPPRVAMPDAADLAFLKRDEEEGGRRRV